MRVPWCVLLLAACGAADPAEPVEPTVRGGVAATTATFGPSGATGATGATGTAPAAAATKPTPAFRCAAGVPAAACTAPALRLCERTATDRAGEWRYALVAGSFEPTQDITADRLAAAWRGGELAATAETQAALAGALGARGAGPLLAPGERPRPEGARWAIVPAHELSPAWSVVTVDGRHPLGDSGGPLAVALCGAAKAPVRNIDPTHLTTLVMSGVTAMTGRTAESIDDTGIAATIRYIKPFFLSADLVHISNEVSFVRRCDPLSGQKELKFCSRESYIGLMEALNTRLVELTGSHLVDYGLVPLERTIDQYARRGWIWFGGGRTQIDATAMRLIEHNGNRLAFVGCNAVNWWIHAIRQGPGTAHCDWRRMVWQIQDARRRGYTPIATVQHRELRTHAPPPDLVSDLRTLAEAGAVFVMGSQAHVAHPWDVHRGAYVHYGPGNILFAQYPEVQRDAAADKLYIYEGRLLTVGHLYTRNERGRPQLLTDAQRARFLGELATAAAKIAPPDPWTAPVIPPETRARPDSLVVAGSSQPLILTVPARIDEGVRYPLIIDLAGTAAVPEDGFHVVRTVRELATAAQIGTFLTTKYPIDPARISITKPTPKPKPTAKAKAKAKTRSRAKARPASPPGA